ncbi:hypothetical protein [Nocardia africana]|uniref:LemA family n=1 Tax=Nocardia africana TaxID=134964 RepID=A0ABW6NU39_9NOCA
MVSQIVTIAVVVGSMATYFTTYLLTRQRNQYELSTRWDSKKLDAYENYVDKLRANVSAALTLYRGSQPEGRPAVAQPEGELREALMESVRVRSRAFERVMLLGSGEVIEAAHSLNAVAEELIWQARGEITGTDEEWLRRFGASRRSTGFTTPLGRIWGFVDRLTARTIRNGRC